MRGVRGCRLLAMGIVLLGAKWAAAEEPVYLDPAKPLEARVDDLLSRMDLEEKIALLHANSRFGTACFPRLRIPPRWMDDGPMGVREEVGPDSWRPAGRTDDFVTALPPTLLLAASWDPDLARQFGEVIGEEARARGKDIMLGPAINIQRTPLCGRNFEYMGEDPYLTSRIAVGYIEGEQSRGVASCVKHFACNNQEMQRNSIDVEVDERALREIYLPAFRAAVTEAHVWTIMGAYNKIRGQFCCQNDYLLNKILKGEWGFQGIVISDWNAAHNTRGVALGGLDCEMGTRGPYDQYFLSTPFQSGIEDGTYPMSLLDEKARRNLRVMIATHVLDGRPPGSMNTIDHQITARKVAEQGIVLLKNQENILPLDPAKVKSIAVIGENAVQMQSRGGGSAGMKAFYEITPLDGIIRRAGPQVNVTYSLGYQLPIMRFGPTSRPATSPTSRGFFPTTAQLNREELPDTKIYDPEELIDRAVRAATQADVVIVMAGLNHARNYDTEGSDRRDMKLPPHEDELIQRVAAANPHTVVVLISGGAVEMDKWIDQVPGLVQAWYPGMEGGNAVANVLFGDANPSGKLPCTFPKQLSDSPAHALAAYPGKDGVEKYEEGIFVGYRWFDTKNIEPLFPFGHGLSYTQFQYSDLKLTEGSDANGPIVSAEFEIANTGSRDGAEVAQLYVTQVQSSLPRPAKELKGFKKIYLKAGEKQKVSIPLNADAFMFYDPGKPGWIGEKGDFKILIGSSSRDIRLNGDFKLNRDLQG
ncbi:MAG TPA: glycoside hydrolase family 3 C-terminal domain-containing protein [Tepidisphaeraceae bacterium]|nr:glycoside hydrolase family 3 C-terminal domain-containing protein [Tepidisphaeraceae bacterium]